MRCLHEQLQQLQGYQNHLHRRIDRLKNMGVLGTDLIGNQFELYRTSLDRFQTCSLQRLHKTLRPIHGLSELYLLGQIRLLTLISHLRCNAHRQIDVTHQLHRNLRLRI